MRNSRRSCFAYDAVSIHEGRVDCAVCCPGYSSIQLLQSTAYTILSNASKAFRAALSLERAAQRLTAISSATRQATTTSTATSKANMASPEWKKKLNEAISENMKKVSWQNSRAMTMLRANTWTYLTAKHTLYSSTAPPQNRTRIPSRIPSLLSDQMEDQRPDLSCIVGLSTSGERRKIRAIIKSELRKRAS